MASQDILRIAFSFLPFMVCLFWFICFAMQYGKADKPKHFFMAYIGTCTVLYLCHGLFFTSGISYEMECLWTLCSLSVYPLFYGYISRLTSIDYKASNLLPLLLPGVAVAIAKYALPDAGIDKVRVLLFACQIVCVCCFGIRMLNAFDRKLQAMYADTEGRDTTAVHHLLIVIIIVSFLAGIGNSLGKQFFGKSLWLLMSISLAFTTMQFALSYICFNRSFSVDQLDIDEDNDKEIKALNANDETEAIGRKIETLMVEQHYFIKKDLKITDLAKEIGSNRTYVSNYINRTFNSSFSDYINSMRIEYAKKLLENPSDNKKLVQIADESGFANEQSFYRNFKKFTGMTPAEWQANRVGGKH